MDTRVIPSRRGLSGAAAKGDDLRSLLFASMDPTAIRKEAKALRAGATPRPVNASNRESERRSSSPDQSAQTARYLDSAGARRHVRAPHESDRAIVLHPDNARAHHGDPHAQPGVFRGWPLCKGTRRRWSATGLTPTS